MHHIVQVRLDDSDTDGDHKRGLFPDWYYTVWTKHNLHRSSTVVLAHVWCSIDLWLYTSRSELYLR